MIQWYSTNSNYKVRLLDCSRVPTAQPHHVEPLIFKLKFTGQKPS